MQPDKKQIDAVTESVMDVYKRVSPSFIESITSQGKKKEFFLKWSNFLVKKLKIPPLLFRGASVLDAGCGIGEKSLVYAAMGADVTGIDVNEKAIAMARKRAADWGLGLQGKAEFRTGSVFEIDTGVLFDIVICDGVIHHTADPGKAFDNIARLLRPGGVLVLGAAEPCGFFQRQLQRYFVNKIAGSSDEKTKADVASMLFAEKLERAAEASGRSVKAATYDSFINPHVAPVPFCDVKTWMARHGIHMDCSWPSVELPLQTDSQYHPLLKNDNPAVLRWERLARFLWMLNDKYDKESFALYANHDPVLFNFLNDVSAICTDTMLDTKKLEQVMSGIGEISTAPLPGFNVKKDFTDFIQDILRIDREIDAMKFRKFSAERIAEGLHFKRLFSGFSGVGMVYYRGTRDTEDMESIR